MRSSRDKLHHEAKQRYMQKIGSINMIDPYEHKTWSSDYDLPDIRFPEIFAYLVCGTSAYTAQQFQSHKSLEAHQLFTGGWVQDL